MLFVNIAKPTLQLQDIGILFDGEANGLMYKHICVSNIQRKYVLFIEMLMVCLR